MSNFIEVGDGFVASPLTKEEKNLFSSMALKLHYKQVSLVIYGQISAIRGMIFFQAGLNFYAHLILKYLKTSLNLLFALLEVREEFSVIESRLSDFALHCLRVQTSTESELTENHTVSCLGSTWTKINMMFIVIVILRVFLMSISVN